MRYDWIDSLRGIAILMVIAVHATQPCTLPDALQSVLNYGARGVQLFFFVSAFTLMLSWDTKQDGAMAFYKRRLFRIVPMWWLAILFWLAFAGFAPRYWAPEGLTWLHYVSTALLLNGWHPTSITSVVPGGWSISVEWTFYLFFPLLALTLRSWLSAGIAFVASLYLSSELFQVAMNAIGDSQPAYLARTFTQLWFFSQLPVFLFGIAAYHLRALWVPAMSKLTFSPLQALGKVSYSAYFWHTIVLAVVAPVIDAGHGIAFFWSFFSTLVAVTFGLSWITFKYVEKPFIRFGASKPWSARGTEQSQDRLPEVPPAQAIAEPSKIRI